MSQTLAALDELRLNFRQVVELLREALRQDTEVDLAKDARIAELTAQFEVQDTANAQAVISITDEVRAFLAEVSAAQPVA